LTVNVNKRGEAVEDAVEAELALEEIGNVIRDVEDYLRKVKAGLASKNPEIAMRLAKRVAKALKTAKKFGLEEEYMKLVKLKTQLSMIESF